MYILLGNPKNMIVIFSAVVLVAISMPSVSFAAGWQRERVGEADEAWVYLDENGNRMTDALIEYNNNLYYLDGNGIMAVNQWVSLPGGSGQGQEDEEAASEVWYYFGSYGKAYRGGRKIIDGNTYVFNEDGSMIAGRLLHMDDDIYYVNEDGAMAVNQWVSFLNGPGIEEPCDEPVTTVWYHFGPNGKAYAGRKKKIGENSYIFDDEGHMLSGWQTYDDEAELYYLGTEDQGYIHTGWVYTYAPENAEASGEEGWYYLDGKGVPFNYQAKDNYVGRDDQGWNYCEKVEGLDPEDSVQGAAARVINQKTYLFDKEGKMITGFCYLQGIKRKGGPSLGVVRLGSNVFTGGFYYFKEEEGADHGQMMIGRQTYEGEEGAYHYYFEDNGQAYINTIVDGSLYNEAGFRVESDSDGYMLCEIPDKIFIIEKGSGKKYKDCTFIVSPSGKLKKSGTVAIDGFKYKVKNYKVVQVEEDD